MTIKDAHQLNAGDTIKIKVSDYKTIQTQIESVSISETGPIIWYYNMEGELKSAEPCDIEGINILSESTKAKKYLKFLEDKIANDINSSAYAAYVIAYRKFKEIFNE